jgi:hypothetical protein
LPNSFIAKSDIPVSLVALKEESNPLSQLLLWCVVFFFFLGSDEVGEERKIKTRKKEFESHLFGGGK